MPYRQPSGNFSDYSTIYLMTIISQNYQLLTMPSRCAHVVLRLSTHGVKA